MYIEHLNYTLRFKIIIFYFYLKSFNQKSVVFAFKLKTGVHLLQMFLELTALNCIYNLTTTELERLKIIINLIKNERKNTNSNENKTI